ncbi:MAG TPA: DoxX family protein [Chthoniobacterales bacterium]
MKYALWIIQGLLAALFIFAGVMKFVMPIETMTQEMPLPGLLLRFIGVCEILGGIGLVLPALLGIRPGLTTLAAIGLIIIMVGAVVITAMSGGPAEAVIPLVVTLLLAFVVHGRQRLRPAALTDS